MSQEARQTRILLFSILIIATNGVIYELLIAGYSSYLLGDSITQFSLTIGVFLSAMGLGSWLTQFVNRHLERRFIEVELLLAFLGGPAVLLLAYSHIYTRVYQWVMFAVIIVLGALIGFEIPLVTRMVQRHESLKKALADVLSFDYLGALFGSILFPMVLLPKMGFSRTSFFIGLLNLGVAFLNIWLFRKVLQKSTKLFLGVAAAIGAILLGGFLFSTGWIESAREKATAQTNVYLAHTPYQTIRFIKEKQSDGAPIYRLYLNREHQFSSNDEHIYHEALVHPAMSAAKQKRRILVLGGGDGLVLRELWRYKGIKEVFLVDLDPAMTQFARSHAIMKQLNKRSLEDPRLRILHQDAYQYLKRCPKPFDVVIIDLPIPSNVALSKLYTVSFYRALRRCVAPHGVFSTEAANLDPTENKPFWSLVATQKKAGWQPHPYAEGTMAFVLSARHNIQTQKLQLQVQARHLHTPLLRLAFHLPKDVQGTREHAPINTLDTHKLMYLTLEQK